MPITSAGPRRRIDGTGTGLPLSANAALTSATALWLGPSVSATVIADAAPCRVQGRKLKLAFGMMLSSDCFEFVRGDHLPLRAAAVQRREPVAVLAPRAHVWIDRSDRAIVVAHDPPADGIDPGCRGRGGIAEPRLAHASRRHARRRATWPL